MQVVIPPFTFRLAPLTNDVSGLATNAIIAATSVVLRALAEIASENARASRTARS